MSLRRPRSEAIFHKACKVIPGGVNSPVRALHGFAIHPLVVERGFGSVIEDVDGHQYIDYCGSFGALIHGHNPLFILEAIQKQLAKGCSFGISTAIEAEIAERITHHLPSIDMLRFVSSGTEAVMSAVRLARAYTGRPTIVKFSGHYHGHSDSLLIKAGSSVGALAESTSLGIPSTYLQHTLCLPFNDIQTCRKVLQEHKDIACVIVEPVAANMGVVPADPQFLEMLRCETLASGALLIFDEVVTGFRLGLQGAQGKYGIDPDLTCLGKIIGGGFPAAAYGGKECVMKMIAPLGGAYQAGTLSGFPLAMAAGNAALIALEDRGVYETLEAKTKRLVRPIREYLQKHGLPAVLQSEGSMVTLFFGTKRVNTYKDVESLGVQAFQRFFLFMLNKGIYIPPSPLETWFVSCSHREEELDHTAEAVIEFLKRDCLISN